MTSKAVVSGSNAAAAASVARVRLRILLWADLLVARAREARSAATLAGAMRALIPFLSRNRPLNSVKCSTQNFQLAA